MQNGIVHFAVLVEVQLRRAPVDTGDLENVPFATVTLRIITIAHVLKQAEAELDDSRTQESTAHSEGCARSNDLQSTSV